MLSVTKDYPIYFEVMIGNIVWLNPWPIHLKDNL